MKNPLNSSYVSLALLSLMQWTPAEALTTLGPLKVKTAISPSALPPGWTQHGPANPDTVLRLRIAIKKNNVEQIEELLLDRSNPQSPNFRKWLSVEETNAMTYPGDDRINAVKGWLTSGGIAPSDIVQDSPAWIRIDIPISHAEKLLDTKYSLFDHPNLPSPIPRSLNYSLPEDVFGLIDTIQPTTALIAPVAANQGPASIDEPAHLKRVPSRWFGKRSFQCNRDAVTPKCLRAYYNVDWTGGNRAGGFVGSAGPIGDRDGDTPSHTDAKLFFSQFAENAPDFKNLGVNGARPEYGTSGEANGDTQLSCGVAAPNQGYYVAVGANGEDLFSGLAGYLQDPKTTPPNVISLSYGTDEHTAGYDYFHRVCHDYMVAGLNGRTLLAASGDNGANNYTNSAGVCTKFLPTFPSTCPYVTAVGATAFNGNGQFTVPTTNPGETAANFGVDGGTGGGFSNVFNVPKWQSGDTSKYIQKLEGNLKSYYNASGRGYPDISAIGYNLRYVYNGNNELFYGTSGSAPVMAGLLALINDNLVAQKKSPLGMLNQFLYADGRYGFTDITTGNGRGSCRKGDGFPSKAGWDPVTGLGTMNFKDFRIIVNDELK